MITGGHPDELFERDFDFVIKILESIIINHLF